MDEKDPKPLTVGDILDQLTKPSNSPVPGIVSRPDSPPPSPAPKPAIPGDFKIPQIGGNKSDVSTNIAQATGPSSVKLSIRTMKDDLARLKSGQKPEAIELKKDIQSKELLSKPPAPNPTLSPSSSTLDVSEVPKPEENVIPQSVLPRSAVLPGINNLPKIKPPFSFRRAPKPEDIKKTRIHDEIEIADKDNVPAFLGAPPPKKKKEEEKVEYSVIARIIGSGVTTGIISTVVVAIIIYGLVYYFFLREESSILNNPTPIPTQTESVQINELNTIFQSYASRTLQISEESTQALSGFMAIVDGEQLEKKEFRRIDIRSKDNSAMLFGSLLSRLGVNYPPNLADLIKSDSIVLLYGQDESFHSQPQGNRLVFIVEIRDAIKLNEVMSSWESGISNDLRSIFKINPADQGSLVFVDHERQGIKIRYKNYPYPDRSIDYAIVTSLAGRHYLVISNSRESMFSPLDKIKGL